MFDGNSIISFLSNSIRQGFKPNKESQNLKQDQTQNQAKDAELNPKQPNQTKPGESLVNTNSSVPINQSTLTSPSLNQTALNTVNKPNPNQTNDPSNTNPKEQGRNMGGGAKDLPTYAGISNMSLKSWVADHSNRNFSNLQSGDKELTSTLDGIKGFQNQNYEGGEEGRSGGEGRRNKNLLILSQMFANPDQVPMQETDLLMNLASFKKLGSNRNNEKMLESSVDENDFKKAPPTPNEPQFLDNVDSSQLKNMSQLLGFPKGFSEFLRLIAKDNIEINKKDLISFIEKRLKYVQEETFGKDKSLNVALAEFAPLMGKNNSPMLPLVLLYYPLPLPQVKGEELALSGWKKKKKEESQNIIASCDIYYLSEKRGRFLIKFELNDKDEFSFNVQTSDENNGVVKDIENAISESMNLLENPPALTEMNVLLTREIYEATDKNEELAIVSSGPIRLEIVIAVYSSLIILNSLNQDPDPSGIIDVVDIIKEQ